MMNICHSKTVAGLLNRISTNQNPATLCCRPCNMAQNMIAIEAFYSYYCMLRWMDLLTCTCTYVVYSTCTLCVYIYRDGGGCTISA